MSKQLITNLTVVVSTDKVTFTDFTEIQLDNIFLVINKTDGVVIFNLAGGTTLNGTVSTNVLTTTFDLSAAGMSDTPTDTYVAFYDDSTGSEGRDVVTYTEYMASGGTTNMNTGESLVGAVASTVRKAIVSLDVTVAGDSSADVDVRIGFSTSTTMPTDPSDGGNVDGIILSHNGVKAGSGIIKRFDPYAIGAAGEEILIANTTPTPGKLKVIIGHLDLTD